ncbi:hypothetical protein [Pontibacter pamirensis]|uniref:hypothetical protein n=1 Tax=Pontibacter pamirensis TaxID=2562824 RepID=UPI001389D31F|nr:hypothetical protein [Pontibacter pamirensis]
MNELTNFYKKLSGCDFIALTPINEGRFYCRFYLNGLYLDRMFITDISLQEELLLLSEDDEMIDENSISRLKDKYAKLLKATDGEGALESAELDK